MILISGIGTDIGKTVVTAILLKALKADYWKPVQTGSSDSEVIKKLLGSSCVEAYKEAYHFSLPLSPHQASSIKIDSKKINIPSSKKLLLIEGCGGVLTPLNHSETLFDLFSSWNLPWILVSRHYLGSLNHTLLSLEKLRSQKVLGIIYIGSNPEGEHFIEKHSGIQALAHMDIEPTIDSSIIKRYAKLWKPQLMQTLNSFGIPLPR